MFPNDRGFPRGLGYAYGIIQPEAEDGFAACGDLDAVEESSSNWESAWIDLGGEA
jgi:hypothetical protein